jgi:hypothetical protein
MARTSANQSIRDVIDESVSAVVARLLPSLLRALNATVDARIRTELAGAKGRRHNRPASSRRAGEITRWVADNRARRVPTFVIDATGLDTKKKIVAKYGVNAAFEKGKSLPPLIEEKSEAERKPRVTAKPPVVRKKQKAA